jgi:hypothetical protein
MDLTTVSQRWLRDLLWEHFADVPRSPRCPRSGRTFDDMRRAGFELSAFLEIHAPGGGHDPAVLTGRHMQQFAADQLQRERQSLPSLAAKGLHGKQSIVTENTRHAVVRNTRRLLRVGLRRGPAARPGSWVHHRYAAGGRYGPPDTAAVPRRRRPRAGRRDQPAGA